MMHPRALACSVANSKGAEKEQQQQKKMKAARADVPNGTRK